MNNFRIVRESETENAIYRIRRTPSDIYYVEIENKKTFKVWESSGYMNEFNAIQDFDEWLELGILSPGLSGDMSEMDLFLRPTPTAPYP